MPWHIEKGGGTCPASQWAVLKDADGETEGCHDTKAKAQAQLAALYASESGAKSMTRTARDGQPRDGTGWYRISAQGDGASQVYLYDLIGMFGVTAKDFLRDLAAVTGPVDVHIASEGGDVFDAYAIYNALAARPGVTTVVDSIAASSASVIAMAGERRLMAKTSQLMIHDAWAGIDGNADDLQHMVDRLHVVSGQIAGIYADTAGGSAEHWRGLMRAETWFTPGQALEAGLITGITETAREAAAAAAGPSGTIPAGTIRAAAAAWDPDGDGDDDSTPEGDTGHSHWTADGKQKKSVPGKPVPGQPPADQVSAASVDESAWDASKAWAAGAASDNPAAFYNAICAGKKAGDPATQGAHALPHHYHPGDPPNRHGVSAALGRLPGTDGLTNKQAAEAHLKSHQSAMGSGSQAAAQFTEGNQAMGDEGALTIEGRRTRIGDINGRLTEVAAAYPAAVLPPDTQAEWDQLVAERRGHLEALEAVEARNAELASIHAANGAAHDVPRPQGQGNGNVPPQQRQRPGTPAVHIHGDIYDLGAIRQQAHNMDELPGLYRDNAMRAVEEHRFPGAPSRETAQANVEKLLNTIPDDVNGTLARRILATGSPAYSRVFGRALQAGNPAALGGRDAQILALGESPDTAGGFAVPFQLDPTIVLTSAGVINPIRQISRIERIVGKEYDLVTSTGVTVHRVAEATVNQDDSPVLAQPAIRAERVQGFIPFSIELEGDWTGLQASMMALLSDAKDIEESSSFTLGTGVAPQAGGLIGTMAAGSNVTSGAVAGAGIAIGDPELLEGAIPVRFRPRASWMAAKPTYITLRNLFAATAGFATDPWNRPSQGQPAQLFGYDAQENSNMATGVAAGLKVLVLGDFGRGFLIVDRVGMSMELVPHLVQQAVAGAGVGLPTGQRGYYVWWRNNSMVLIPNAFRVLVLH